MEINSEGQQATQISSSQTWYLSKNLHNRILGPKILHTIFTEEETA